MVKREKTEAEQKWTVRREKGMMGREEGRR